MSVTTKKKHVTKEVLESFPLPDEVRQVVQVKAPRGNNLHEVVGADGETYLVSMPTKFRKHVWIKRGDFIIVEPIAEGDKVKAEISHILFKDQIKHIQENGLWPEAFSEKSTQQSEAVVPEDLLPRSDDEDSDTDLASLVINVNRVQLDQPESDSEDSCSEEEEDEEEEDDDESEKTDAVDCKSEDSGRDTEPDSFTGNENDDSCLKPT